MGYVLAALGIGLAFLAILGLMLAKLSPEGSAIMLVLLLLVMFGAVWGYWDELRIERDQSEKNDVRDHK